jgi:hypothetical protein
MKSPTPHKSDIAGYDFGSERSAKSPVSAEELRHLEQTLGWTGDDERLLKKHAALFEAQADGISLRYFRIKQSMTTL